MIETDCALEILFFSPWNFPRYALKILIFILSALVIIYSLFKNDEKFIRIFFLHLRSENSNFQSGFCNSDFENSVNLPQAKYVACTVNVGVH